MADNSPSPAATGSQAKTNPTAPAAKPVAPNSGRRESSASVQSPIDQAAVAAAVAAAVTNLEQQRQASQRTPDLDKTVPGGVYIVDGQCVDCNGELRELPKTDESEEA